MTFSGPMGRYRAQLLLGSQVRQTQEFTLNPAVTETLRLMQRMAAETPGEEQASIRDGGGGGFPIAIVALIGLAGAGAAVGLLAGGGGNGEPEPQTCPTGQRWDGTRCVPIVTTGGIIIAIPTIP